MGWRLPERKIEDNQVVDVFDFQDAIRPVVEEAQGLLDEHNFSDGMSSGLGLDDLPSDVPFRWAHARKVEPNFRFLPSEGDTEATPGTVDHPFSLSWSEVGTGVELTLTEATAVHIVAGLQFWFDDALVSTFRNRTQVRFGVSINGHVYPDAIWGSQDYAEEGDQSEKGYYARAGAPMIEATINLPPGNHRFEIVYQTTQPIGDISGGAYSDYAGWIDTANEEILVMALER